ncbi:SMI1/KNR4 family protein [bacterium]|nr:SMI1/KNR4 family protein [bacterium]
MKLDDLVAAIREPGPPITADELERKIKRAEMMLDARLPRSYVRFLSRYGRPFTTELTAICRDMDRPNCIFSMSWYTGFSEVDPDSVSALHLLPADDLFHELNQIPVRYPPGCIPFADCLMSNTVLIDVSKGGETVYQWWKDEFIYEENEPRSYYYNMSRLANSFDEFIEKLEFEKDD